MISMMALRSERSHQDHGVTMTLQVLSMLNPIMRESKVGAGAEALLCLGSLPSFQIFGKPE